MFLIPLGGWNNEISILVRAQIRKLLKDPIFDTKLLNTELAAWSSFKAIGMDFWSNRKCDNYSSVVNNLLASTKTWGVECRLKITSYIPTLKSSQKMWEP